MEQMKVSKGRGRGRGRITEAQLAAARASFPGVEIQMYPGPEQEPAPEKKMESKVVEKPPTTSSEIPVAGPSSTSRKKTPSPSHPKKSDQDFRKAESAVVVGLDVLSLSEIKVSKPDSMKRTEAWIQSLPVVFSGAGHRSSEDNVIKNTLKAIVQPIPYRPLPDDIAPEPEGFRGALFRGQEWRYCPYNNSHTFSSATHLFKCRKKYLAQCEIKEEPVKIMLCSFDCDHHVHMDRLKEHEANCPNRNSRPHISLPYMKEN